MKRIQDLGEFLESQAGDDPVSVSCPKCDGKGYIFDPFPGKRVPCKRCDGRGLIRNPDLEP